QQSGRRTRSRYFRRCGHRQGQGARLDLRSHRRLYPHQRFLPQLSLIPVSERRLVLVAACALIDADGRVLISQRPPGKTMAGLWEFPGGKIEAGERPEDTVIREMHEELGIVITEACLAPFAFASHSYPEFHLLMPLFLCRRWEGIP